MSSIRESILKAADSIENNPNMFDFGSTDKVNTDCGHKGCALGWIAYHAAADGVIPRQKYDTHDSPFAPELYAALGEPENCVFYSLDSYGRDWRESAQACAEALRKYANHEHPCPNIKKSKKKSAPTIKR